MKRHNYAIRLTMKYLLQNIRSIYSYVMYLVHIYVWFVRYKILIAINLNSQYL